MGLCLPRTVGPISLSSLAVSVIIEPKVGAENGDEMTAQIEPLASDLWARRIEKIANGDLGGIEQSLRHASHLVQLSPPAYRHVVMLSIDERQFESLLASGNFDTAARHLIAEPTALSIESSRDNAHLVTATISCKTVGRAFQGTGDTTAKAVLSAWTSNLLALPADPQEYQVAGTHQFSPKISHERDVRLS
jgi:hypothetical protein